MSASRQEFLLVLVDIREVLAFCSAYLVLSVAQLGVFPRLVSVILSWSWLGLIPGDLLQPAVLDFSMVRLLEYFSYPCACIRVLWIVLVSWGLVALPFSLLDE